MMHTYIQASPKKASDVLAPLSLHTTLYDLIAAVDAEAGPDADDMVTATVIHTLQTHRVSCLGDFEGYQMVLNEKETSRSAVAETFQVGLCSMRQEFS